MHKHAVNYRICERNAEAISREIDWLQLTNSLQVIKTVKIESGFAKSDATKKKLLHKQT